MVNAGVIFLIFAAANHSEESEYKRRTVVEYAVQPLFRLERAHFGQCVGAPLGHENFAFVCILLCFSRRRASSFALTTARARFGPSRADEIAFAETLAQAAHRAVSGSELKRACSISDPQERQCRSIKNKCSDTETLIAQ